MPDDLTRLAGLHRHLVVVVVFHLGVLLHQFIVLFQFFFCAQHHFVLHLARVFDDEFNGLACLDHDAVRFEAHGVEHVHTDGALGIGSLARFAYGL